MALIVVPDRSAWSAPLGPTSGQDYRVHVGPADAAVVVQVTTDNYSPGGGWTAVYDCVAGFQGTSSLNNTGPIASNLAFVRSDLNGDICVRSMRNTDLIVDLAGVLSAASIQTPSRVLDTRATGPSLDAQQERRVHVGPVDAAVVVQVTTDNYSPGGGWTAVYDCVAGFQGTSSLNNIGPIASNLAFVRSDQNGDVCVRSMRNTDLIVDLAGVLSAASIQTPSRVLDTRATGPSLDAQQERRVHVGPVDAAVVVQVTTDNYSPGGGWTAVYDCNAGFQGTSSLNNIGPIASNLAFVRSDHNGDICVRSMRNTDLIVDLAGVLSASSIQTPSRVLDTRSAPQTYLPAADASWLEVMNNYRRQSGVGEVAAEPTWIEGQLRHIAYMRNTSRSLIAGQYASLHTENPASPWYSPEGAAAAGSSNIGYGRTDRDAMDGWMRAPFHAAGVLRPNLTRSAFASDGSTALLDVIRGLGPGSARTEPILFPGARGWTYLTSFTGELPDPREGCQGGGSRFTGLPIMAILPDSPPVGTTATLLGPDRQAVEGPELCVQTEHTYHSSDPIYGATGESIMQYENLVLVIPRRPLINGQYLVNLQMPGRPTISWYFTVAPAP